MQGCPDDSAKKNLAIARFLFCRGGGIDFVDPILGELQKKSLLTSFDLDFLHFKSPKQARLLKMQKAQRYAPGFSFAEEEGFEPPVPLGTTVFKTAAIDHSATPLIIINFILVIGRQVCHSSRKSLFFRIANVALNFEFTNVIHPKIIPRRLNH
jgi:hypothetical protein